MYASRDDGLFELVKYELGYSAVFEPPWLASKRDGGVMEMLVYIDETPLPCCSGFLVLLLLLSLLRAVEFFIAGFRPSSIFFLYEKVASITVCYICLVRLPLLVRY